MGEFAYMPRIADEELDIKLKSAGAVVIRGPKWCGKTETALQRAESCIFMQDPDKRESYKQLASEKPSLLLEGEKPRLIDEWQEDPSLWDAVRFWVDRHHAKGAFILTGSATPGNMPAHSGTGRIVHLGMRPMSLWESGESNGKVLLAQLFDGKQPETAECEGDIERIALQVSRGGWPAAVTESDRRIALETAKSYITAVAEEDVSRVDGTERRPSYARLIMRSYARCVGTQADMKTISMNLRSQGLELSRPTVSSYIGALRNIFVIEDLPAWNPSLRAKSRITTTPKRFFVDPSLACAALGGAPGLLLEDMPTLGALFESLCIRDLRIYAESLGGSVFFYHDSTGLEADAVVVLEDGRWGLVEIKLGLSAVEDAAKKLLKLESKIDCQTMGEPAFKMVITGSGFSHRREDGVNVVPISCLRP